MRGRIRTCPGCTPPLRGRIARASGHLRNDDSGASLGPHTEDALWLARTTDHGTMPSDKPSPTWRRLCQVPGGVPLCRGDGRSQWPCWRRSASCPHRWSGFWAVLVRDNWPGPRSRLLSASPPWSGPCFSVRPLPGPRTRPPGQEMPAAAASPASGGLVAGDVARPQWSGRERPVARTPSPASTTRTKACPTGRLSWSGRRPTRASPRPCTASALPDRPSSLPVRGLRRPRATSPRKRSRPEPVTRACLTIPTCLATPCTHSRRTGRRAKYIQYDALRPARREHAPDAARPPSGRRGELSDRP